MANDINKLRDTMFDAIDLLKEKKIDVPTATAISTMSQTIINSIRVEIDARRFAGSKALPSFITDAQQYELTPEEHEVASNELDLLLPK